MKIIFIGTVIASREILTHLIECKEEIVGVVTSKTNKFNSDNANLENVSKRNNIPILKTNDINNQNVKKWIAQKSPEIIICMGWSSLLDENTLNLCKRGVIGFHPSMLPFNRGRHPIIWSLALGLKETGSTFFKMTKEADCAKILSQKKISIKHNDYADDLYKKIVDVAKKQIVEVIKNYDYLIKFARKGKKGNYWRKRSFIDGKIDWRMRAIDIFNLIRALSKPYPGAHFTYRNKEYKVWRSAIESTSLKDNIEPGKIISTSKKNIVVKCGSSSIKLININNGQFKRGEYL